MKVIYKKTLLLVEDEVLIAISKKQELEKYNYIIITVNTGEKAVETLKEKNTIDLILMDIDLGRGIDGTIAAKLILKDHELPIVFLSSHTEPEIVEKTEKITSYGYVVKNSSTAVLDASIKMAFRLFEANKKLANEKKHLKITLDSIGDAVIATDTHGNITRMNGVAEKLTEWSLSDALNKPLSQVFNIINAETRDNIENIALKVLKNKTTYGLANNTVLVSHTGKEYQIEDSVSPIKDDNGKIKGVILVFSDVTEKYKLKENLMMSELRFRTMINKAPIGIALADPITGQIDELNPVFAKIAGRTVEEMKDLEWMSITHPDDIQEDLDNMALLNAGKISGFQMEKRFIHKDGVAVWTKMTVARIFLENQIHPKHLCMIEDISQYKQAEKAQQESVRQYHTIIDSSPDNITVTDLTGKIQFFSLKALEMFRGEKIDDYIGRSVLDFIAPEDRERAMANIGNMQSNPTPGPEEYLGLRIDGSTFEMEINGAYIYYPDGNPKQLLFIVRDITRWKRTMNKFKMLFELSPVGITLSEKKTGRFLDVNNSIIKATGYSKDELLKFTHWDITPDEHKELEQKQMNMLNKTGFNGPYEKENIRKDGSQYPILISGAQLIDEKGREVVWAIIEDISKQKLDKDKINNLLAEKELILKEVHHRVINNMNTMVNLLNLQTGILEDSPCREILKDAENRMRSMVMLYEKLFKSDNFSDISIKEYINSLINEIISNFPNSHLMQIETSIEDFVLDVKKLQPLGIIVNELLTNIMKYAFPEKTSGLIKITANEKSGRVTLTISDNGIGLPKGFDLNNQTGFGLMLVKMLSEQLEGQFTIVSNKGTKSTLDF
jgi:PAS domain S-box-containing protein